MKKGPSEILRTDLMEYLRYEKQFYVIASEVKYNNCWSDVLGERKGKIHEFEVKVSKQDFLKDFKKKLGSKRYRNQENKHAVYKKASSSSKFVPHYFHFVVPEELELFVLEYCRDHGFGHYGVLVRTEGVRLPFRVAKRPSQLNKSPLNKRVVDKIVMRATSELVTLRRQILDTK